MEWEFVTFINKGNKKPSKSNSTFRQSHREMQNTALVEDVSMNRWIPSREKTQHPSLFPDQSDSEEGGSEINNAIMQLIGWKIPFGAKCQTCCAGGVWRCEMCMCVGAYVSVLREARCESGAVYRLGNFKCISIFVLFLIFLEHHNKPTILTDLSLFAFHLFEKK